MNDKVAINGIGQIAVAISELDRSIAFYQNVLGLNLLFKVEPNLAFFDIKGVRLMLTTLQGNSADHQTSAIYYKVNDIQNTFKLLIESGVCIERPPQLAATMPKHQLWIGFIRDPDKNLIGIMAELPLDLET
jgi:predicted enzyme related to lactoylglutathione lyase